MQNYTQRVENNRILVIDEDSGIRETYARILSESPADEVLSRGASLFDDDAEAQARSNNERFEVTLVENGEKALLEIERSVTEERPFAVAFIEIKITGLEGAETAKRLWDVDRELKIIFVTTLSERTPADINRVTGRSDSFYLRKPFNPEEIRQFARALTKEWTLEREREQLSRELIGLNAELEYVNQHLNERVEQQTAMLLQAEKMASIGTLAAGVAHKIQAPVLNVREQLVALDEILANLNASIVERTVWEDDFDERLVEARRRLDQSRVGIDRIAKIIVDLQRFSKSDETEYRSTDLHGLIDSTLYVIQDQQDRTIDIIKVYDTSIPPLKCFPGKLSQVFINLLINAGQAIKGGGVIRIQTELLSSARRRYDPRARITISDTGCGIPESDQTRIFDPFFTTKTVSGGTGLGLSVAYDIVKAHGGRITVESRVGEGTTFTILLPLAVPV
jgi:two-component system, NtrC family, sensor kinase